MKAAILTTDGIKLKDIPKPEPNKDEVLIKNKAVGICGTDLSILNGDYKIPLPRILGHEFSGIIEKVGSNVKNLSIGERVTSEINVSCGTCFFCRSGIRTQCLTVKALGIYLDGAFAEYTKTPAYNVHKIGEMSFEKATFIEPLAAAINTFRLSLIKNNTDYENVVIIGLGKLGLLILQVASILEGKRVFAIGRSHLDLAKDLGADIVISRNDNYRKKIHDLTDGIGADVVIEATGTPEGIEMAVDLVRNRGLICLKSTHGLKVPIDVTSIVVKELTIQGSRCGDFIEAIKKIDKIRLEPLISKVYPLTDIEEAINAAKKSENIKIIIKPEWEK
jgi:alcohol dehydrogenase